jgi:ribosome recycling factor
MFDLPTITTTYDTAIANLHKELASLRTGRANASLVDSLLVEYYGVSTPLIQVASISTTDPRTLSISPWDKKAIPAIEKAILKATHLGLSPVADKDVVRINIPALTEERRRELTKMAHAKGEDFKVEIRRIRDEVRTDIKQLEKTKQITEDEKFSYFEELDNLTKDYVKKVDDIVKQKEEEIMSV